MTISSSTRVAGPFVGNGTTAAFPFAFKVFAASDMYVVRLNTSTNVETVLALTTDYTVSLNADQNTSPGGTVTLVAGVLASGFTLTITSSVPLTQATDLTNQGGFYPSVINNALDKLTILAQQLSQESGRQIVAPISDGTVDMELPPAAQRASQYLAFDASGLPIAAQSTPGTVVVSAFMQTVLDDSTAAAARTTLGGLVTLTGAETLTSKTLTAPVISTISNTGTLTLPTSTDTLVGRATTDTLSNKSLTSPVLGSGDATGTPVAGTMRGANASGTNVAGVSLTIRAGSGTGNAAGGSLVLQTAPAGSSGTTVGTPANRLVVDSAGAIQTGAASAATGYTSAGDITLPATGRVRGLNTAKAWVNWAYGTPPTVTSSFNVSSVALNATGDYTINFTNAMADANYCPLGTGNWNPTLGQLTSVYVKGDNPPTTTALRVGTSYPNVGMQNSAINFIAVFGN